MTQIVAATRGGIAAAAEAEPAPLAPLEADRAAAAADPGPPAEPTAVPVGSRVDRPDGSGCDWRVSAHYTRHQVWSGRFGGRRDLIARSCCCGSALCDFRLVFEDGRPIAGAELCDAVGRIVASSDATGLVHGADGRRVTWKDIAGTWTLGGRRLFRKGWRPRRRGETERVLELWSAGRSLEGTVVDQNGVTVPDVVVTITGADSHDATTDAAGRFALAEVTPSRLAVTVRHPELFRNPMPDWIDTGRPGPAAVTVRAVRGEAHEVHVLNDDDGPVTGAVVRYAYEWPEAVNGTRRHWTYEAEADTHGVARLLVVPGAELDASVEAKGFPTRELRGLAGLMPPRLERRLRRRSVDTWMPVRCRDAETGADVRPAAIFVRRSDQPWIVADVHRPAAADATCHPSGSPDPDTDFPVLDLPNLPGTDWEVWCWSPGYAPALVAGAATDGGVYPPLAVELAPGPAPLEVRVAAAGTGATLEQAQVRVAAAAGQGGFVHAARFHQAVDCTDGVATFDLPPGDYDVTATACHHTTVTRRVTLDAGTGRVVLGLAPAKR